MIWYRSAAKSKRKRNVYQQIQRFQKPGTFDNRDSELKQKILDLTAEWSRRQHKGQRPGNDAGKTEFIAGETPIPYAALLQKRKLFCS